MTAPGTSPAGGDSPRQESAAAVMQRLGPAGVLAVAAAVMPLAGSALLFYYAGTVTDFIAGMGGWGLVLYIGAFALLAGLALLPTYAQCAMGGFIFGVASGFPAAMAGIVGAAVLAYELDRRIAADRVEAILREHPRWRHVRDALVGTDEQGHGFWRTLGLIALVRLPPNSPFALTNLVLASVRAHRGAYILGTIAGIAPRSLLAVYIGAGVSAFTKDSLAGPKWIVLGAGVALTIIVVVVLGKIGSRALNRLGRPAAEHTVEPGS